MTSPTTPAPAEQPVPSGIRRRTVFGLTAAGAAAASLAVPRAAEAAQGATDDCGSSDFALTWRDEFDGAELDPETWEYELGNMRGNEQEHYSSGTQNVRVQDGRLILAVTDRPEQDQYRNTEQHGDDARLVKYNSGSVRTHAGKDFLYGKIEVRARMPKGKGAFPALWTLGHDFPDGARISRAQGYAWPSTGEVDIAEIIGAPTEERAAEGEEAHPGTSNRKLFGTPHFWNTVGDADGDGTYEPYALGGDTTANADLHDDFHVFGVNRTPTKLEWLLDGTVYHTLDLSSADDPADADRRAAAQAGLNRPAYLLINLATGGNWAGDAGDHLAEDGTRFEVDWVRFSQTAQQKRQDADYRDDMPALRGVRDLVIRQGEAADLVADVTVDREDHVVELSVNDSPLFVNTGAPGGRNEVRRRVDSADDADAVAALPVGVYALHYTAMPRDADVTGGQIPSVLTDRERATLVVLPQEGLEGDPRSTVGTIDMPAGFTFQDPGQRVDQHDEFLVDFVNPDDPLPFEERPSWTFTLPADAITVRPTPERGSRPRRS